MSSGEADLLGKIHGMLRSAETYLERFPYMDQYPVYLPFIQAFNYMALSSVENIDEEPDDILSFDWKNLIILDACRHDTYEEVNGSCEYRITKSSMSRGFIRKNFSSGDFSDTVYITANPFFSPEKFKQLTGRKPDDVFHEVFHTYRTDWDNEENTVLPESVKRDAETAEKLFPEKKKIIHFMQPHHPFIGTDLVEGGFDDILSHKVNTSEWDLGMRGEIDHEKLVEAYRENLEKAMPHARELAEKLRGRTMVTSDHGNLLGENGLYWHPPRSKSLPLRKVPMTEIH